MSRIWFSEEQYNFFQEEAVMIIHSDFTATTRMLHLADPVVSVVVADSDLIQTLQIVESFNPNVLRTGKQKDWKEGGTSDTEHLLSMEEGGDKIV